MEKRQRRKEGKTKLAKRANAITCEWWWLFAAAAMLFWTLIIGGKKTGRQLFLVIAQLQRKIGKRRKHKTRALWTNYKVPLFVIGRPGSEHSNKKLSVWTRSLESLISPSFGNFTTQLSARLIVCLETGTQTERVQTQHTQTFNTGFGAHSGTDNLFVH